MFKQMDVLDWAGMVACHKKTSLFLQNKRNTKTIGTGLQFNNQEDLISEGNIS